MIGCEESDKSEKWQQTYAALGVGFVCVIIGLPLWWKTTEVYRVTLPYNDIADFSSIKIKCAVDIEVVNAEPALSDVDLTKLSTLISSGLETTSDRVIYPHYRLIVKQATEQQKKEAAVQTDIQYIDKVFSLKDAINKYQLVLLPSNTRVKIRKPFVGNHRQSYIPVGQRELSSISMEIIKVIQFAVFKELALHRIYRDKIAAKRSQPDKERMRSVRSFPGYDLLFTLVNPQPDIQDVQWDIKEAVQEFLGPLTEQIKDYAKLNIQSQVVYFSGLYKRPKKDPNLKEFYYTEKDLPLLINPLEAKLGSHASNNPTLNFLVYIPSRDQHPLYILDQAGMKVQSNSFMSPRWGGISIYNVPSPSQNASLPQEVHLDMKKVMEVIISQLRLLLNFNSQIPDDIVTADVSNQVIRHWELDSWLRQRCIENLATSIATLQSLTQLLGKISNIVINDDIGKQVEEAVAGIKQSQKYLAIGQLDKAFIQSRSALVASEKAFFDPSLLELLYFPEDQKFAIYIPLFLPISLPIVGSLYKAFQWMKTQRKPKQE